MSATVGMMELIDHVRLGRTEASRKGVELRRRQALAAQYQHLAGEERVLDLLERGVAQRCGQIDAGRLEAEVRMQLRQREHQSPALKPVREESTVHGNGGAGGVARRRRREVHRGADEFGQLAESPHRRARDRECLARVGHLLLVRAAS